MILSRKTIFVANTLNMMISASLVNSPRNVLSIPAFNLRKKKFDGGTLYMDFDKKFLKMSNE